MRLAVARRLLVAYRQEQTEFDIELPTEISCPNDRCPPGQNTPGYGRRIPFRSPNTVTSDSAALSDMFRRLPRQRTRTGCTCCCRARCSARCRARQRASPPSVYMARMSRCSLDRRHVSAHVLRSVDRAAEHAGKILETGCRCLTTGRRRLARSPAAIAHEKTVAYERR